MSLEVDKIGADFGFNAINPDIEMVKEILGKNSADFNELLPSEIAHYMFVLSRYKMYVQGKLNLVRAKTNYLERSLNLSLDKDATKTKFLTSDERRNIAINGSEAHKNNFQKLQNLRFERDQLEGMPELIEGIISRLNNFRFQRNQEGM